MKPALKFVHPLLLAGIALFLLPLISLPVEIGDIVPSSKAGPCSVPVFLLFVPGEIMILIGLGFSGIRLYELSAEKRRTEGKS